MNSTRKSRACEKGIALWEVLIWVGFISGSLWGMQIKVSTHWRQRLAALQKMRIPYTGRGAR